MYYFGGGTCGCGCNNFPSSCCGWGNNWGNNWGFNNNFGSCSSYAIVLVLFILLVIVIGSRFTR